MAILDTAKYRNQVLDGLGRLSETGVEVTNGLSGSRHISNTDTYTGDFIAVNVIADAKFHTLTGNAIDSANATEGSAPLYPAGTVLYGKFTAIKLHSGRVQAYNS